MNNVRVPGIWFQPEEVMALVFAKDAVLRVLKDTPDSDDLSPKIKKQPNLPMLTK